jgi:hypothetical protein
LRARLPATARARRRLQHPRGRDDYKLRARTVEPVFGQLKTCQKVTTISRRKPGGVRKRMAASLRRAQPAQATPPTRGRLTNKGPSPGSQRSRSPNTRSRRPYLRSRSPSARPTRLYATGWFCMAALGVNARFCRDPRFRLPQITRRTTGAHHPTEDICPTCRAGMRIGSGTRPVCLAAQVSVAGVLLAQSRLCCQVEIGLDYRQR